MSTDMARAPDISSESLQEYYNNPQFSDVTICFSGHEVYAHKHILSMASKFFRNAFAGGFREANSRELRRYDDDPDAIFIMLKYIYGQKLNEDTNGDLQQVLLQDDNPEAVQTMLKYIYGHPIEECEYACEISHFNETVEVFILASKYETPQVCADAARICKKFLDIEASGLPDDGEDFLCLVRRIYQDIPRCGGELVQVATEACAEHGDTLFMEEAQEEFRSQKSRRYC